MNEKQYGGSDILSDDDFDTLKLNQAELLEGLHRKVELSDKAREWLNTPLGEAVRTFIATDKMRSMKRCTLERDPEKLRTAQIDYEAVCKLEQMFGTILVDGKESLIQLQSLEQGDNYEN